MMQIDKSGFMQQVNRIGLNNSFLSKIHEKLSTGKRINRASDDAAGLAIAKQLESMARGLQQSDSNIGDALGAMKIAEGAGGEISDMLQRQRELSIQASNGTLSDRDRQALNSEYQALNQEIDRIANSTQFNGQNLTDGSSPLADGTGNIQAGANNDEASRRSFTATDFRASSIGSSGGDISTVAGAQAAISTADNALQSVNQTRSSLGANMNTLEHTQNNNANTAINTVQAQSLIEDLDFAKGVMEQSRNQLLLQSSMQASSNFNSIAKNNMMALLQ